MLPRPRRRMGDATLFVAMFLTFALLQGRVFGVGYGGDVDEFSRFAHPFVWSSHFRTFSFSFLLLLPP